MAETVDELYSEIDIALKSLFDDFTILKDKYAKPTQLSHYDYTWLVFSHTIYFRAVDLLLLVKDHEANGNKIKIPVYTLFRSILEDYFYLKLATSDPKKIELHLKALIASSQINNRNNLKSLLELEAVGKYIPNPNSTQVTSLDGLRRKIAEYEKNIQTIKNVGNEMIRLINIYSNTRNVCKEYDKLNGITKVVNGEEVKCLEWLYCFIFKFTSASVHQVLNDKEAILDLLWYSKSYTGENTEVLSLLLVLLKDIKTLSTPKV